MRSNWQPRKSLRAPSSTRLQIMEGKSPERRQAPCCSVTAGVPRTQQHIAAELIIRYKADRPAISAIALTTDSSALTACGNDLGFEALFERQVEGLGRPGDAAIGISTSGNSPNVLRALTKAREMKLCTIGLTGRYGRANARCV